MKGLQSELVFFCGEGVAPLGFTVQDSYKMKTLGAYSAHIKDCHRGMPVVPTALTDIFSLAGLHSGLAAYGSGYIPGTLQREMMQLVTAIHGACSFT